MTPADWLRVSLLNECGVPLTVNSGCLPPAAGEEPGWGKREGRTMFLIMKADHHGGSIQHSFVRWKISSYSFRQALLYCQG